MQGFDLQSLAQLAIRRAPWLVTAALIAGLFAELLSLAHPPIVSVKSARRDHRPAAHSGVPDLASIHRANLFGILASSATGDPDSLPVSLANLRLTGVVAYADPARGFAVLGQSTGSSRLYQVGADLGGGAALRAVYADRIVIARDGNLETLVLPKAVGEALLAQQPPQAQEEEVAVMHDAPRDHSLRGLVEVAPVFDGAARGIAVAPSYGEQNMAEFMGAGFQPGDLVVAVNGVPIQNARQGTKLMATLEGASFASVTVMRNDQRMDLDLHTR